MPRVELIYDGDCPNLADARTQLLRAFAKTMVNPRWKEWRGDAADSPERVRGYGSPTVLVGGKDVAAIEDNGGASSCRLYEQPNGSMRGVPSVDMITAAIEGHSKATAACLYGGRGWKLNLAVLPGIGAALLPKVACAACWPAYAGFLSSLGLGFLVNTAYLLPMTAMFLMMAVGSLAFRARRRRGYKPFALGIAASTVVLIGKFYFEREPAMYGGLALLVAASIWNSWPQIRPPTTCTSCVGETEPTTQLVS